MAPKANKGKVVASSSHESKRSTMGQEAPNEDATCNHSHQGIMGSIGSRSKKVRSGLKSTKSQNISHELFIERASLASEFPHIVERLHTLGLDFVFNDPGECNLNMVRKFLVNWDPKKRSNQVNIQGKIVNFLLVVLKRLLGSPSIDPQSFKDLIMRLSIEQFITFSVLRIGRKVGPPTVKLRMNGVIEEQLQQLNMDYPLSKYLRDLCKVRP
ncbi:hypothetical protein HAX54_023549 [Datura stramonium]|uniref:Uncharacterized protein n=1 Tax=Datura stramonium TaxID=4076 RepID=A0ABS8S503_DATST|nr:hypothetical protein [Datura stramonium]